MSDDGPIAGCSSFWKEMKGGGNEEGGGGLFLPDSGLWLLMGC